MPQAAAASVFTAGNQTSPRSVFIHFQPQHSPHPGQGGQLGGSHNNLRLIAQYGSRQIITGNKSNLLDMEESNE